MGRSSPRAEVAPTRGARALLTMKHEIRVTDLFCGVGGWSTAARRVGLGVAVALDLDPTAIEWHRRNHPRTFHLERNALDVDWGALAKIAGTRGLLLASPPCQGHSSGSRPARRGTGGSHKPDAKKAARRADTQRAAAWAIPDALRHLQPRAALVENVAGFLAWPDYSAWSEACEGYGYHLSAAVLNAADYGAPTDRARAIVFLHEKEPEPFEGSVKLPRARVGDVLDFDHDPRNRWSTVADKPEWTRELIRRKQREAGISRGILNNVGDGVRLRSLDDLAPTLTTKSGSQLMLVDGDRARILNPLELARIMGWRTSDRLKLPPQRALAGKLVGNAISPNLAEACIRYTLNNI